MSNNLNLVLAVVGILFAAIPVIGWFFRREEHRQLDVVLDKEVYLVNQLAGNLKNFSIVIEGKPSSEQVVWITGWIINSGNSDISERIVEHPLTLKLPENMQWLRGTIVHYSSDVTCNSHIIGSQELEFRWVLLRSGEYIHFDALLQCPLEETKEVWDISSLAEKVTPYSRMENIHTGSLIPLSDLGERYNPLKTRKLNIMRKLIVTFLGVLLLVPIWMIVFFPFELDQLFGDGFLRARLSIVKMIDGIPAELKVSVDKENKIKLTLNQPSIDKHLQEELLFNTPEELFSQEDIRLGKILARGSSEDTIGIIVTGIPSIIITWGLLYMWFPGMFLFGSTKRRTVSALYALQRQKIGKQSDS